MKRTATGHQQPAAHRAAPTGTATPPRGGQGGGGAGGGRRPPTAVGTADRPDGLVLTLPIPYPLLTINWRRRYPDWRTQARETRQQRNDAGWWLVHNQGKNIPQNILARDIFGTKKVRVDVEIRPRKGMKRHDDSAIWEAMKPLFDALQDRGIVRDDKQLVHGALVWSEVRSGEFVLTLSTEM